MRYLIGTRVRLIASDNHPESIGGEGVVIEHLENNLRGCDYTVDFPGDIGPNGKTHWGCCHDQLEPIINDGNNLTTWDECVWQPGKVTA